MSADNIENDVENIPEMGLSDRGIAAQAWGFGIVGCVSVAILRLYSDSDHWLYLWFEVAVTQLYWAFLVPLAALIDWGRIMFAKGKAIREAKKAEILAKAAQEGLERGMQAGLERGMQQGIEQGLDRGMQQGVIQERKRTNASLRAWAKERGISEDDLPFLDEDA